MSQQSSVWHPLRFLLSVFFFAYNGVNHHLFEKYFIRLIFLWLLYSFDDRVTRVAGIWFRAVAYNESAN